MATKRYTPEEMKRDADEVELYRGEFDRIERGLSDRLSGELRQGADAERRAARLEQLADWMMDRLTPCAALCGHNECAERRRLSLDFNLKRLSLLADPKTEPTP